MRFGNATPIATEVARGDFHGSGEDNEPKALSATRRGDHPRRLAGGPLRGYFIALRMPPHRRHYQWLRARVVLSPTRPCGVRGARTAPRFPTPSCLPYVEN